jgi:rhomboid protease GluP
MSSLSEQDGVGPQESAGQGEQPQARMVRVQLPLYRPLWTYVLLAINIVVFLAMTALGGSENVNTLVFFGAKYNPYIIAGQYWRLLTACFVHVGIIHLLFNSYALYVFGSEVERRYGGGRFLALYLLSGVGGSTLSFLGSPRLAAGASGAIFGLVGAMIAYFATYREQFGAWGKRRLSSVLLVAGYNLVFGFIASGIDNYAHVGGLLAGLLIGWAYCPRYQLDMASAVAEDPSMEDRVPAARAWLVSGGLILLLLLLVYLGVLRWT